MKVAIAISACIALAGCTATADRMPVGPGSEQRQAPVRQPDPVRGLDLADRNCSLCHSVSAAGRSPHPRAPGFSRLAATYPMDALRAGLSTGEVIGHKGMPQIVFEPQQIDDLIAYMRSIATPPAP